MFRLIIIVTALIFIIKPLAASDPVILFQEDFEDTEFASRGWYDHLKGKLTTAEHVEGSTASLECKYLLGERGAEGGSPGRHLFEETDEVYLSYYVKYSANYIGSGKPYHPHEFHFITNANHKYVGPAYTHLTTYIEHNGGTPLLAIQDAENIDEDNIGVDLTNVTEERSVAGCNGSSDGYYGDCYQSGNVHNNGKQWKAEMKYFSDNPGNFYKNDWHHIEAYFKLNSIADGKGLTDGIVQYWFDEVLIIDHDDVMMRTGQHPDMMFNQFLIAPYIGPGSPVEQIMWIDNLLVATSRIISSGTEDQHTKSDITSVTPNPFSQSTEIRFRVSSPDFVSINIYNSIGEKISVLDLGLHEAGEYSIRFDSKDQPAGMYYFTIIMGANIESGKMMKVK